MKRNNFKTLFVLVLILLSSTQTNFVTAGEKFSSKTSETEVAKEVFVSPSGDDLNPGTREKPFLTVQKALENIKEGETVTLLKGTYRLENSVTLSCKGKKNAWITLRGEKGTQAFLDGKDYNIDNTKDYPHNKGLIQIENSEYVRVQNIYVRNSHRAGINIQASKNIDIINCTTENSLSPGISAWQRCEYIRVLGNTVINANDSTMSWTTYRGHEAPHEAISMAGPHYFEVAFNHVYNCKKEGIDVKETASHGKVHHNYVHDCLRQGLYIDGWFGQLQDIEMYENVVHGCEAGIAVSSEEGPNTKDLKINHNLIYNNRATGIFFSRWGADNPRENVEVNNNTFYRNGWGPNFSGDSQYWLNGGCYLYSTNIKNVKIHNNIFALNFPFEIGHTSLLNKDEMKAQDIVIDSNLIFDKNEFDYPIYLEQWAKDSVYSITGTNAILKDPLFENQDKGDFRLKKNSQAIISDKKEKTATGNYAGAFPPGTSVNDFWWKQNFPPQINVEELEK
jgi:hypothetical protein